jgi:hypothetical protein
MSGEGSGSVDDVWNAMKSLDSDMQEEYRHRAKTNHKSSVTAAMELLGQKQKGKTKTKAKMSKKSDGVVKPKAPKKSTVEMLVSVEDVTVVEEPAREVNFRLSYVAMHLIHCVFRKKQ